jgi:hypothetical protein
MTTAPLPEPLSPSEEKKLRAAWALIGAWEEREDGSYQCPLCHGEGEVDGFVLDATNVCPGTIAGYGIGDGLAAAELVAESTGALLSTLDAVRAERDAARGENERLREAVAWALEHGRSTGWPHSADQMLYEAKLRAALKEPQR